jgi:hypothetical protein
MSATRRCVGACERAIGATCATPAGNVDAAETALRECAAASRDVAAVSLWFVLVGVGLAAWMVAILLYVSRQS